VDRESFARQKLEKRYSLLRRRAVPFQFSCWVWRLSFVSLSKAPGTVSLAAGEKFNPALCEPFCDSACVQGLP
jgi:hypothetical protein